MGISEALDFSPEEQGNLLKGYLASQQPLARSNFLSSYCDAKKLKDGARVIFISSHLADQALSMQVEYLAPFMSEMQKPVKMEFLAEYAKTKFLEPKASAELIHAYTKRDGELGPTATLKQMAEKRKLSLTQSAELCSASIFLTSSKDKKLDLAAASSELTEFVGDLDPQRARRYLIKMAEKEGVKTDAGIMERAGNWLSDIGDRFHGRKTPEEILFKGDTARMAAAYTPKATVVSTPTRSVSSESVRQEPPRLTRAISDTLSVSSASTGIDSPSPRSPTPKAGSKDDSELRAVLAKKGQSTPPFPPKPKKEATGRGRSGTF